MAVSVRGLRELVRALEAADREQAKGLKHELKVGGEIVAGDARSRFSSIYAPSASTMQPRVRGFGTVVVEQKRRRVTGKRGDFGSLQMRRAFVPALAAKSAEVIEHMDRMLDRMAGHFD